MLLTNPERAVSCALFCKFIFTKPLIFESTLSVFNEPKKGKAGCFAVADFWKEIGEMSKTNALAQLEKFFYQGLEHKGVQLPDVARARASCTLFRCQ
jgi:hypothetical protein